MLSTRQDCAGNKSPDPGIRRRRSLEGYSPSGRKELDKTEHVDTLAYNAAVQRGTGSIPAGGAKTPHASWPKKKIRT